MAAASIMTAAGLTAFFKTRFPDREVQNLVCYDKPLLSALSKKDDLEGVETLIPFQLDVPQGMSVALVTVAVCGRALRSKRKSPTNSG